VLIKIRGIKTYKRGVFFHEIESNQRIATALRTDAWMAFSFNLQAEASVSMSNCSLQSFS